MDAIHVMTVSEAAKVLRVRRVVLEEMIRIGKVKAFSVGPKRGTRITMKALEEFIEANTIMPKAKRVARERLGRRRGGAPRRKTSSQGHQ